MYNFFSAGLAVLDEKIMLRNYLYNSARSLKRVQELSVVTYTMRYWFIHQYEIAYNVSSVVCLSVVDPLL